VNLAADFVKPDIQYGLISPMLIVFGVATLGVLVEAFVARRSRYLVQTALALIGVVGALVATVLVAAGLAVASRSAAPSRSMVPRCSSGGRSWRWPW
jgi:NADH-quinone oxidoreductase subunit N